MAMRFVFLGTGTSSGVPVIGCGCEVCGSGDPRDRRLRTAGAIVFDDPAGQERVVLLDSGPDLRQQALTHGLTRCDAILYTHHHVDHTFGLDEVRRFNAVQKAPVDLYGSAHTLGFLRRVYQHIFEPSKNVNKSFVAEVIPHAIEEDRPFGLLGLNVTPVPLMHGRQEVLGYRIEAPPGAAQDLFPLAYCTDVSAVPPASWGKLRGLRTLVLDALRHRHHPTHLTLEQAVHIASEVGAASTYFVHMAHDLPHEATQALLPPGMFLAYDGLILGG